MECPNSRVGEVWVFSGIAICLVCYTAIFSVITQRSSPLCVADYYLLGLVRTDLCSRESAREGG